MALRHARKAVGFVYFAVGQCSCCRDMEMVEEEAQRSRMGWEEAAALLVQSERVERVLGR